MRKECGLSLLSLSLSFSPSLPLSPINECDLTVYVKENFKTHQLLFCLSFHCFNMKSTS